MLIPIKGLVFAVVFAGLAAVGIAQRNVTVATDGVTLMYNQPSAVHYQGTKNLTYFGWVDSLGQAFLRTYDHGTSLFDTPRLIRTWTGPDDHAAPALHVVKHGARAGYLLVASAFHSSPLLLQTSTARESTIMGAPVTLSSRPNTYPRFVETDNGTIFLFTRGHPTVNPSSRGLVHMYKSTNGGVSWTGPKTVVTWSLNTFVYAGPIRSFGNKIGFAFGIFDSVSRRYLPEVYFVESLDSGATWRTPLGGPASNSIGANIPYIRRSPWGGQVRIWDSAYDNQGRPLVAHVEYASEYSPVPNFLTSYGIVTQLKPNYWASRTVTPIGMSYYPSGLVFSSGNPFRVFGAVPASARGTELAVFDSLNQGTSWARTSTVAAGGYNIRPQAVFNAAPDLPVTWLDSRSYSEYRVYDTSVMARIGALP